jgi:hypothetical protein
MKLQAFTPYSPPHQQAQPLKASNQREGIEITGNNLLGKALKLAIHATPKEIEEATIKANLNDINGMIQQIANFTSEYGNTLTIQELQHKPFGMQPCVRTDEKEPSFIVAELGTPYNRNQLIQITLYSQNELKTKTGKIEKVQTLPKLTEQITKIRDWVLTLKEGRSIDYNEESMIQEIVEKSGQTTTTATIRE